MHEIVSRNRTNVEDKMSQSFLKIWKSNINLHSVYGTQNTISTVAVRVHLHWITFSQRNGLGLGELTKYVRGCQRQIIHVSVHSKLVTFRKKKHSNKFIWPIVFWMISPKELFHLVWIDLITFFPNCICFNHIVWRFADATKYHTLYKIPSEISWLGCECANVVFQLNELIRSKTMRMCKKQPYLS